VVFAHATGTYNLRIAGVVVPQDTRSADAATEFVRNLVLNRNVRMRMEGGRLRTGELHVRLFTADSVPGIRDVGVEVVRAGLARRQVNYDYKYGELAAAEAEARQARRGVWQPR
jgi:endonuclease YncB( thermonuclease family)